MHVYLCGIRIVEIVYVCARAGEMAGNVFCLFGPLVYSDQLTFIRELSFLSRSEVPRAVHI